MCSFPALDDGLYLSIDNLQTYFDRLSESCVRLIQASRSDLSINEASCDEASRYKTNNAP